MYDNIYIMLQKYMKLSEKLYNMLQKVHVSELRNYNVYT